MKLKPKNYKEKSTSTSKMDELTKTMIIDIIKGFVVTKPEHYEDIIKVIQKSYNFTNDQLSPLIDEVKYEWFPEEAP